MPPRCHPRADHHDRAASPIGHWRGERRREHLLHGGRLGRSHTTFAPRAASVRAIAAPMPLVEPVTTTLRPERSFDSFTFEKLTQERRAEVYQTRREGVDFFQTTDSFAHRATRPRRLLSALRELYSAEELGVEGDNDGGKAHKNRADRRVEGDAGPRESSCGERDGNDVVASCPG